MVLQGLPVPYVTALHHDAAADETLYELTSKPTHLIFLEARNVNTTDAYLQIFDVAYKRDITLGTTAPTLALLIPGSDGLRVGATDKYFPYPQSLVFHKGLSYAVTTTSTGSTGPTTDCEVEMVYTAGEAI